MKIYSEDFLIEYNKEDLDLEYGCLKPTVREIQIEEQEYIEEKGHYETIAEYPETGGKDVQWVVDVEGRPYIEAHTEYEDCQVYHVYSDDELKTLGKYQYSEDELLVIKLKAQNEEFQNFLLKTDHLLIEWILEDLGTEKQIQELREERRYKREIIKANRKKVYELTGEKI